MSLLPDSITSQPLNTLAIPGSHNSFSSRITKDSKPSPDGDVYDWIKYLPDSIASSLLYPWSVTQDVDMAEQLRVGIRYFDLRVAVRVNESGSDEFILVHGQYATPIADELQSIVEFLRTYPKEVLLIDCNHCYEFETEKHTKDFELSVLNVLRPFLYPCTNSVPSLQDVWSAGKQILFFSCQMTQNNTVFWPVSRMVSLWPNTDSPSEMIRYLDEHYGTKYSRNPNNFYVFQGVLTPTVSFVLNNLGGSLRQLANSAGQAFMAWLKDPQRTAGSSTLNISLIDFVHTDFPDYASTVIKLNHST